MTGVPSARPPGTFADIFLDRHHDLRGGWKVLLFVLLAGGGSSLAALLLSGGVADVPFAGAFATTGIALLASWLMTRFISHKPLAAVGLWFHDRTFREFGLGLLLGFLMMAAIVLVELTLGYVRVAWRGLPAMEVAGDVGISFLIFALAAFAEELLFRGYAFQTLIQSITIAPAMLVMSLLFGLGHLANPHTTALSTVNVVLAGVWLSFAYIRTRSLWLPFGLHLAWNFSQTTIFAFPTSGLAFEDRMLWQMEQTGPGWVTGGAFGPEGGVLATLALLGCTWYILKSRVVRVPEGIITLDSLEDLLPPVAVSGGEGQ